MKTIIIGDIHGMGVWKNILEKETYDRVIFVGDYFDSFDIPGLVQIQNFSEIVNFKKESDKEVIMLIGNHDFHYLPEIGYTGTSGFQKKLFYSIMTYVTEHREHLQMCYLFDNVLVSHAGISPVWLNKCGWNNEPIDEFVNDLYKYKPNFFKFDGNNPYGDDSGQTPIWIRPRSLMNDCRDDFKNKFIQVVGHTGQNTIDIEGKSTGGKYFFIDTLPKEYLILEDGKFIKGITSNLVGK